MKWPKKWLDAVRNESTYRSNSGVGEANVLHYLYEVGALKDPPPVYRCKKCSHVYNGIKPAGMRCVFYKDECPNCAEPLGEPCDGEIEVIEDVS
jgi:hypothetical protein